jgi:hypothetical protein
MLYIEREVYLMAKKLTAGNLLGALGSKSLDDASKIGAKVVVATTKTLKDLKTETKLAITGVGLSIASNMLDLDNPAGAVGLGAVGIDDWVGKAGELMMYGAGASALYKFGKNLSKELEKDYSDEELITELGIEDYIEDETEEE